MEQQIQMEPQGKISIKSNLDSIDEVIHSICLLKLKDGGHIQSTLP